MEIRILLLLVLTMMVKQLSSQVSNNDLSGDISSVRIGQIERNALCFSGTANEIRYNSRVSTLLSDSVGLTIMRKGANERRWIKAAVLPTALIVAGVVTDAVPESTFFSKHKIQDKMLETFPGIDTPIDNYLQFVPAVAMYGLKAAGVKSRNDLLNQTIILAKAELLMGVVVHAMKMFIRIERPDKIGMNTMPSGHTAQAFLTATILDKEYREASPWISVGGYAVAATTAAGRIVNNRHWVSDVLIGAGIGIFSARLVYLTHQNRWGRKSNAVFVPMIYPNGGGAALAWQF